MTLGNEGYHSQKGMISLSMLGRLVDLYIRTPISPLPTTVPYKFLIFVYTYINITSFMSLCILHRNTDCKEKYDIKTH